MRIKCKIANLNVAINILTALILDFSHFKRHIETLDPLPSTVDMYSQPSTFEYTPLRQFVCYKNKIIDHEIFYLHDLFRRFKRPHRDTLFNYRNVVVDVFCSSILRCLTCAVWRLHVTTGRLDLLQCLRLTATRTTSD